LRLFSPSWVPTSPSSLSPHGAGLGPRRRRPPSALHCRRTPPRRATPPLHRRAAVSSESTPRLLVQRLALLTVMLPLKTLPRLDLRSDGAGCAKEPPHGEHDTESVVRAAGHSVGRAAPAGRRAPLCRPPRLKGRSHGPDLADALFKPFLFSFYLNKF
jgi:hypothetical protein